MNDFLGQLLERSYSATPRLRPRLASAFEPSRQESGPVEDPMNAPPAPLETPVMANTALPAHQPFVAATPDPPRPSAINLSSPSEPMVRAHPSAASVAVSSEGTPAVAPDGPPTNAGRESIREPSASRDVSQVGPAVPTPPPDRHSDTTPFHLARARVEDSVESASERTSASAPIRPRLVQSPFPIDVEQPGRAPSPGEHASIHVTIGRVDVRAVPEDAPKRPNARAPRRTPSLDTFLRRKGEST